MKKINNKKEVTLSGNVYPIKDIERFIMTDETYRLFVTVDYHSYKITFGTPSKIDGGEFVFKHTDVDSTLAITGLMVAGAYHAKKLLDDYKVIEKNSQLDEF